MIKMRYEELTSQHFLRAAGKLANMPMRSPAAFRVKHVVNALEKQRLAVQEEFKKDIMAKFAKGGETPEPPTAEHLAMNLPFTPIEGVEKEAQHAIELFGKREFQLDQPKIPGHVLFEGGEWSAAELAALEGLVEEGSYVTAVP